MAGQSGGPPVVAQCMRMLTSTFGLFVINMTYLLLGAWLFLAIEAPREASLKNNLEEERDTLVDHIIALGLGPEDYYRGNASEKLAAYELQLANFYRKRATFELASGNESLSNLKLWSYEGAIIYCYSVITTIGWGNIVPNTINGKLGTVIYGLNGMPLFFSLSSEVGNICSRTTFRVWTSFRKTVLPVIKKRPAGMGNKSGSKSMSRTANDNRARHEEHGSRSTSRGTNGWDTAADRVDDDRTMLVGGASDRMLPNFTGFSRKRGRYKPARDHPDGWTMLHRSRNSVYLKNARSCIDFMLYAHSELRSGRKPEALPHFRVKSKEDALLLCAQFSRMSTDQLITCMEYAGFDYAKEILGRTNKPTQEDVFRAKTTTTNSRDVSIDSRMIPPFERASGEALTVSVLLQKGLHSSPTSCVINMDTPLLNPSPTLKHVLDDQAHTRYIALQDIHKPAETGTQMSKFTNLSEYTQSALNCGQATEHKLAAIKCGTSRKQSLHNCSSSTPKDCKIQQDSSRHVHKSDPSSDPVSRVHKSDPLNDPVSRVHKSDPVSRVHMSRSVDTPDGTAYRPGRTQPMKPASLNTEIEVRQISDFPEMTPHNLRHTKLTDCNQTPRPPPEHAPGNSTSAIIIIANKPENTPVTGSGNGPGSTNNADRRTQTRRLEEHAGLCVARSGAVTVLDRQCIFTENDPRLSRGLANTSICDLGAGNGSLPKYSPRRSCVTSTADNDKRSMNSVTNMCTQTPRSAGHSREMYNVHTPNVNKHSRVGVFDFPSGQDHGSYEQHDLYPRTKEGARCNQQDKLHQTKTPEKQNMKQHLYFENTDVVWNNHQNNDSSLKLIQREATNKEINPRQELTADDRITQSLHKQGTCTIGENQHISNDQQHTVGRGRQFVLPETRPCLLQAEKHISDDQQQTVGRGRQHVLPETRPCFFQVEQAGCNNYDVKPNDDNNTNTHIIQHPQLARTNLGPCLVHSSARPRLINANMAEYKVVSDKNYSSRVDYQTQAPAICTHSLTPEFNQQARQDSRLPQHHSVSMPDTSYTSHNQNKNVAGSGPLTPPVFVDDNSRKHLGISNLETSVTTEQNASSISNSVVSLRTQTVGKTALFSDPQTPGHDSVSMAGGAIVSNLIGHVRDIDLQKQPTSDARVEESTRALYKTDERRHLTHIGNSVDISSCTGTQPRRPHEGLNSSISREPCTTRHTHRGVIDRFVSVMDAVKDNTGQFSMTGDRGQQTRLLCCSNNRRTRMENISKENMYSVSADSISVRQDSHASELYDITNETCHATHVNAARPGMETFPVQYISQVTTRKPGNQHVANQSFVDVGQRSGNQCHDQCEGHTLYKHGNVNRNHDKEKDGKDEDDDDDDDEDDDYYNDDDDADDDNICTAYSYGRMHDPNEEDDDDDDEFISGRGFGFVWTDIPELSDDEDQYDAEAAEANRLEFAHVRAQIEAFEVSTEAAKAKAHERPGNPLERFHVPLFVMYILVILYVLMGAVVFYIWDESLEFWDSLYFIYVMLSTTGFGDLLPKPSMYAFIVVYALVGMALYNIMINATLELFMEVLEYLASIGDR